jgi:hypothetical protein
MRRLLLALTLAGCPKVPPTAPPTDAPAAVVQPPLLPTDAAWPASGLPPQPARRGMGTAEDLRELTRQQEIFTVEAALPALAALGADALPALVASLEADPRWRVGLWEGRTVAWKRCRDGADWTAGWAGYCRSDGAEWRVMLVFDSAPPAEADPASGGRFKVRAGPSQPDGWRSATLLAAGPAAWLEIHERATDLALTHTADALTRLDGEMSALQQGQTARAPAPAPTLQRKPGPTGEDVRFTVSMRDGGWVWLAPTRGSSTPEVAALTTALTAERVRGEAAWFQVQCPLPTDVQVWVWPDGAPARALDPGIPGS